MQVSINYIKEGAILKQDVYDYNGTKLITAGSRVSNTALEKLKERGIRYLDIQLTDEEKKMIALTEFSPSLPSLTEEKTKESVRRLNVDKNSIATRLKDIIHNAEEIVYNVIKNIPLSYKLVDYKRQLDSSDHAVKVAIFSVILANEYNKIAMFPAYINLEEIATAALLHDIGESCKNPEIRASLGELPRLGKNIEGITEEKYNELSQVYDEKYVPYYSYCLLKDVQEISSVTKNMVLLSREDEAMTGPLKAKISADKAYKKSTNVIGAKIINICSLYDSYLVKNIQDSATLENVSAALLATMMDKKFEVDLIKMFLKAIPLYPLKTKVQISGSKRNEDGSYEKFETYGVVIENFDDIRTYHLPKVLTPLGIIDLRTTTSITISNVMGDEKDFTELYDVKTEAEAYNAPKK